MAEDCGMIDSEGMYLIDFVHHLIFLAVLSGSARATICNDADCSSSVVSVLENAMPIQTE